MRTLTIAILFILTAITANAYCTPPITNDPYAWSSYHQCLDNERLYQQQLQWEMERKQRELERRLREMEDKARIGGY